MGYQEWREKNRAQGLCSCGNTPPPGRKSCEQCRENTKAWKRANRDKVANYNGNYWRTGGGASHRYGLTHEEHQKLLIEATHCGICKKELTHKHIDHDHNTGIIRGVLCPGCNTGLGKLGDSIEGLQRAITYLTVFAALQAEVD